MAYVQNVKAFHMNWISALIIMPLLFVLNQKLSPEFDWYIIVGLCWGGAIVLHAIVIFGMFKLFGGEWEQKVFLERLSQLQNQ